MSNKKRLELSNKVAERIKNNRPYGHLIERGKRIDNQLKRGKK
jgi:hypothetical protein